MVDQRRPLCVRSETDPDSAACLYRLHGRCCHSCFEDSCPLEAERRLLARREESGQLTNRPAA